LQISSIIDIVSGELLHHPSISFITQIHTQILKVNDGDLFIGKNQDDIELAIENGAFAILFDFDVKVTDSEIAWIKVDDITIAQTKLLRFLLSGKDIKSFYCDDISFEFFNIYSYLNKDLVLLSNNISTDFEVLKNITNTQKIVFSTDKQYIKTIQPLAQEFIVDIKQIENLTQHSLFNTTFSYKDKFFYKLKIPSIYIKNFLAVYEFLGLELDLNRLKNFKYFMPIFINKYFEIVDFGKSNKFILANDKQSLIDMEIKFLNIYYTYANVVVINNPQDDNELFKIIENYQYNALYIKGKSIQEINDILVCNKKEILNLF
jgi:ferrochelatase